jgi:CRISPR-associated protein Cas1
VVQALENNIDVIFLDKYGDPIGRIWFAKMGSTALIRRKQLAASETRQGVLLVLEMIQRKMENQVRFLKRLMHARPGQEKPFQNAIPIIEQSLENLDIEEESMDAVRNRLMGLEGSAGRAYFQCLAGIMPEKYRFSGRSRRPAKDPFNAVLNYCYGILYGRVEKTLILAGLDPFVGFMHTDNYNKKSLVFDFIEPFRVFAEQTAVYLFTGKKVKDDFFDAGEKAVSLNKTGKPIVVEAINTHLEEGIRYRRKNVKRKHIIQHEAHRMANILLDGTEEKRPDWLEIQEF